LVLGQLEARHGRCPPLAGKSTLNRLEHGGAERDRYRRIAREGAAIEALFVDLPRRPRAAAEGDRPTTAGASTSRAAAHRNELHGTGEPDFSSVCG
jgi:hypothetical protein